MKYNVSIRKMIVGISLVLISVILGQGIYTFFGSTSIKHGSSDIQLKSKNIEEHILPASAYTQKFLSTFEKMDTKKQQVVDLSLNNVPGIEDLADGTLSDFESLGDEAKGLLDSIQKYHKSVYVDTLRQRFDAFSTGTQGILETLADGDKPSSEEIANAVESTKGISGLVEKIAKNNATETGANFKAVKETALSNSRLAGQFNMVAAAIFVVLMGVVVYFLYYIIALVHSIRKLATDSNEIRKGDLNHKVVQERGDEMGELQSSFDNMRLEVKDFIENLDRKVQERTKEVVDEKKKVSALLNNMKQAVIKINSDLVIVPPASAYAVEVFGEEVVGKSIFETLYSGLSERSEEKVQLDSAFVAVFGEGEMQWDLSCDGLIPRVVRTVDGQAQILRVNYAPLWDDDENLEEIMMVIEDITELERLAIEKKKNEERIGIIQEISQVPMNDLEDYFQSASRLFNDAQVIMDKGQFDLDNLGLLFRTLHTLKGNSRVFGLTMIGSAVHEVETHVGHATELARQGENLGSSLVHALHDSLFVAFSRLNVYADVANHFFKLGVDLRKDILEALHDDLVYAESCMHLSKALEKDEFVALGARIARNSSLLDDEDIKARAARLKSSMAKHGASSLIAEELHALGALLLDRFGPHLVPVGFSEKIGVLAGLAETMGLKALLSGEINRDLKTALEKNWFSLNDQVNGNSVLSSLLATEFAFCTAIAFDEAQINLIAKDLNSKLSLKSWFNKPHFKGSILGAFTDLDFSTEDQKQVFDALAKSIGLANAVEYFELIAKLDVEKASYVCQEAFVKKGVGLELFKSEPTTAQLIRVVVESRGEVDFFVKSWLNAILYEAMEIHKSLFEGVEIRQSVNAGKLAELEAALVQFKDGETADASRLWLLYRQLSYADVRSALNRYRAMVLELSNNLDKKVRFELKGDELAMASENLGLLLDSMVHLIRNSLDHGLESREERRSSSKSEEGALVINLKSHGDRALIEIEDDGKGIDPELVYAKALAKGLLKESELSADEKLQLIFLPGFSTKDAVTDLSGRGVGMDVVKRNIEGALNGKIQLSSKVGQGTKFTIEFPI